MAKYLTPINLNQLELQKAVVENYPGNPNGSISGIEGQILWDSVGDKLYVCTGGTVWSLASGEIDTNTTYAMSAETVTGGANLRLTSANPSTTDDVKIAGGTNVTVTRTDDSTITISSTDTNTTSLPVKDSAGTVQFTPTDATGIRFTGAGSAAVTFTPATQLVTITGTDTNTATHTDGIMDGSNTGTAVTYEPYAAAAAGKLSYTAAPVAGVTDLSFSGYFRANRLYGGEVYDNGSRVLTAHPTIVAAASVNNAGRTYIQDITLDANGHITGLTSATETVVDTNTTYSISAETATGGVNLRLTDSGAGTDDVKLANGANVTLTRTDANTITVASSYTDTNWYPTAFAWTAGTTAGPTGSLTGSGMSAVSYAAIPAASGSASGIVTTDTQTFAGDKTFSGNMILSGNLTVNGTTVTVNSTTMTTDDPIITLGGDTAPGADDGKDRGIEFRYFSTTAKIGFIGWDQSAQKFVLLHTATNTSEVFSGTKAELDANVDWSNILNKPDPTVTVTLTGDVTGTGNATLTDLGNGTISFATTIAADSVALGTDTTGNYVASVGAGTIGAQTGSSGLVITGTGEGAAVTLAHADTSTITGAQGTAGIASITVDGMGHVTAVTTATYMRRVVDTITTSTTVVSTKVVTHNLNTRDVIVMIRRTGTPYDEVIADVEMTDLNTLTVKAAAEAVATSYTIIVIG